MKGRTMVSFVYSWKKFFLFVKPQEAYVLGHIYNCKKPMSQKNGWNLFFRRVKIVKWITQIGWHRLKMELWNDQIRCIKQHSCSSFLFHLLIDSCLTFQLLWWELMGKRIFSMNCLIYWFVYTEFHYSCMYHKTLSHLQFITWYESLTCQIALKCAILTPNIYDQCLSWPVL